MGWEEPPLRLSSSAFILSRLIVAFCFFFEQEEHLGGYPGAPHIVAVNSHLATFFTRRRSTWENVQGHTQVGEAWRRAAHLSHPVENLYCCNARSGFVPGGKC